ncbi:MAG: hypothetical protein OEN01_01065, partial [Candidatus Krumholzibacteria bacterium]|nr:hypothetical protein [Candidatus Krumholzibacteria bacterium]
TPGFNIKDATGQVYVIKFDPPGFLGLTTGAGVVSNRILYGAGYNVPDDAVVTFRREDVAVGPGVELKDGAAMTEVDLDALLSSVAALPSGEWLAISSRFLDGKPVGPFDYKGRRKDDANDRVRHEDRRELRGLYVFAAWLSHFDTKQHNSLDMYVTENGRSYIKHHLIDFASTLGAGARGPAARHGYEFTVDPLPFFGRIISAGLIEDPWRRRTRPRELPEVGFFDSEQFDPKRFKPLQPNTAFANTTRRDAYWAAKIVAAFTDEHIRAIVEQAKYPHAEATNYITHAMIVRRDKIARAFFEEIPPLDFFVNSGGGVRFTDLGVKHHVYPGASTRYRVRCAAVNADRKAASWTPWTDLSGNIISLSSGPAATASQADGEYPFLAIELQVDRGQGWSRSVTAYRARASGRVIAVDR